MNVNLLNLKFIEVGIEKICDLTTILINYIL